MVEPFRQKEVAPWYQDLRSRHERFHQQTADLQLPRTALCRQRRDGDRARRLRRNREARSCDWRRDCVHLWQA